MPPIFPRFKMFFILFECPAGLSWIEEICCVGRQDICCVQTRSLVRLQTRNLWCLQTRICCVYRQEIRGLPRHPNGMDNTGGGAAFGGPPVWSIELGCLGRPQISCLQTQQISCLQTTDFLSADTTDFLSTDTI